MSQPLKGYWVAHVDVDNLEAYQNYVAANASPFQEFGARFLVRGTPQDVVEGKVRSRTVVLEFPSLAAAQACYHSEGYQAAKELRTPVSTADLTIIEGWGAANA